MRVELKKINSRRENSKIYIILEQLSLFHAKIIFVLTISLAYNHNKIWLKTMYACVILGISCVNLTVLMSNNCAYN